MRYSKVQSVRRLERIAEADENATSRADWWQRREELLTTSAPRQDWDTKKVAELEEQLAKYESLVAKIGINGQLKLGIDQAYSMMTGITTRRPELGGNMGRWKALWMQGIK